MAEWLGNSDMIEEVRDDTKVMMCSAATFLENFGVEELEIYIY